MTATAARLGGDEFLILLDEAGTDDQIILIAERLVAEISLAPYRNSNKEKADIQGRLT
jgi:GGDEF domain-containing protein